MAPVTRGWRAAAALALGLVLAARLAWPSWIHFDGEQCEVIALAWRSLHEGLAQRGLRVSVGVEMPPAYVWLASIAVAFTQDPVALSACVSVVNVLALGLMFAWLRANLGERPAWYATLLLASAPWAILFSRRLWAQDLIFPLALAAYAALFAWRAKPSAARAALAGGALGLLFQIYPSAWFLAPPLLAWAWIVRWRPRAVHVGAAALVALVLWAPHVLFRIREGFPDVHNFRYARQAEAQETRETLPTLGEHALLPLRIAGGTGWLEAVDARDHAEWSAAGDVRLFGAVAWAALIASAAGLAWAFGRAARTLVRARRGVPIGTGDAVVLLLALALAGLIAANGLLRLPPLPHYAIAAYPAVPVLAAAALDRALGARGGRSAWSALAIVAGVSIAQAGLWLRYVDYLRGSARIPLARYAPVYPHVRPGVDRELARALDEARHGREREERERAQHEARFTAARDVLFALDPVRNRPAIVPVQGVEIAPGPDGLDLRGTRPPALVELPRFELATGERALLRLELESPVEGYWLIFHTGPEGAGYLRRHVIELKVDRGRDVVFAWLDGSSMGQPLRLGVPTWRAKIRALEIRRAKDP